jgi:hypothetical protein
MELLGSQNLILSFAQTSLCLLRYPVCSGMQDFNYLASNCFELTFEIGCNKFPPGKELPSLWNDNQKSLLNFMSKVKISSPSRSVDSRPGSHRY